MRQDFKPVDATASAATTDATACIAAQGAGIRTCLKAVVIANTSATAILVTIKSGTTTRLPIAVPADSTAGVSLGEDGLLGGANEAWNFQSSDAVNTVYCTMVGHIQK